jgi:L-aminoadipate-semialdehyde dehydrogenase
MIEKLIQILHGALSNPTKPIGTITMLTESQRRLLPDPTQNLHWNDFVGPIHEIFDRNAICRPDHPCAIETSYVDRDERIHSYRKIYEASNIVAHYRNVEESPAETLSWSTPIEMWTWLL